MVCYQGSLPDQGSIPLFGPGPRRAPLQLKLYSGAGGRFWATDSGKVTGLGTANAPGAAHLGAGTCHHHRYSADLRGPIAVTAVSRDESPLTLDPLMPRPKPTYRS